MQNPFYNANSICKMSGGSCSALCAGVELNISYYCHIMATNNRLIAHSAFRISLGAGGFVHFACASVCVGAVCAELYPHSLGTSFGHTQPLLTAFAGSARAA
jgi:hypothetical protein